MASNRFPVSLVKGSVLTPDSGPPWDLRMGLSVVMTEGIGLAAVSWFKGYWMFGEVQQIFSTSCDRCFLSRGCLLHWSCCDWSSLRKTCWVVQPLDKTCWNRPGGPQVLTYDESPPPLGTGSCQMEKMDMGCMLLGRLVIYPVQNTRSVSYVCIWLYNVYI